MTCEDDYMQRVVSDLAALNFLMVAEYVLCNVAGIDKQTCE